MNVLVVPGFTGSGPDHWHSHWERLHPEWGRVEQADWDHPEPQAWVAALNQAIERSPGRVALAAHSLGCVTVARWADTFPADRVAGAFLVAPSDVEASTAPPEVVCFAPIPLRRLPFPSMVVTSNDDPLVTLPRAAQFAGSWGARFISIGAAGHINTASGHGPWPEGLALFGAFLAELERGR